LLKNGSISANVKGVNNKWKKKHLKVQLKN
jgi:hypothetical protein